MEPNKIDEKWRNEDGTLKPGHPSLPGAGRPKGKTMKEFAREYLMNMTDEAKREWLAKMPTDIVWKMAEGNPHQSSDANLNVILPKPIADVLPNNGVQEDKGTEQAP